MTRKLPLPQSQRPPARKLRRFIVGLLLVALAVAGVARAQTPTPPVGVYYVGPEDAIAEALNLSAPYLVRVDQPDLAQVLVINNAPLRDDLQRFGRQVQQGRVGLVIFSGPHFPQDIADLSDLLGVSTFEMRRTNLPATLRVGAEADPLAGALMWASAPELTARTIVSNPNLLRAIVVTTRLEPVVQRVRGRETTQIFLVSGWLSNPANDAWPAWPYFNYFIYRLTAEAANAPRLLSFADFPLAPVPQGSLRWGLTGWGVGVMAGVLAMLFLARRQIFLNPELGDVEISALSEDVAPPGSVAWQKVGFHRPLAGFLALLSVSAICFVPLLYYRLIILPQNLIPWAQTLNFWQQVTLWLQVVWVLLDAGLGVAMVRTFAALRARYPQTAFRYVQLYVWWQLVSGGIQMGVVVLLAALVFPQTMLAHLSYYFVIHALVQFPGFLQVFRLFFRAIQRFDYEQVLTALLLIGGAGIQAFTVLLTRWWGARNPALGEAMGGVLGLGVGLYLTEWLVFAVGVALYRRMGYAWRAIFVPAFNWRVIRQTFGFGLRLTLGYLWMPVFAVLLPRLLEGLLPDAATLYHYWGLALYFLFAYEIAAFSLYDDLLPALVEALTHGYTTLARYYVGRGFHYGLWFSLFVLAILGGMGEYVLVGWLGAAYVEAAGLLTLLLIWGALHWLVWGADRALIAADRPALAAWLTWGEMALRLGLMVVLVPRWQAEGLAAAVLAGTIARGIMGWWLVRRVIAPPRFYVWQSLVAPTGAALLIYNLTRLPGTFLAPEPGLSLGLLWGALVFLLPLYGFLTAFLGGWDDGGVAELTRAVSLSGMGRVLGGALAWCVTVGAQASPLHGRYPVALREIAEAEAEALTMIKPVT